MMGPCEYCGARAQNKDHVIPRYKQRQYAFKIPIHLLATVPACFACNMAKGTLLLVPPSWEQYLDAINDLAIGRFRLWNGDPATRFVPPRAPSARREAVE